MNLRQKMQTLQRQVRAAARQGATVNVNVARRTNVVAVRNVGAPGRVTVASSSQSAPIVQTQPEPARERENRA